MCVIDGKKQAAGAFCKMTPKHLQNTHSDHSSDGVIILCHTIIWSVIFCLWVCVCVCVLFGAWHKQPLTFSHVMRPWLDKAVTWRTTVSSYTKCYTDTRVHKAEKMSSIWDISLIFLSFLRHHKGRNTRTHTYSIHTCRSTRSSGHQRHIRECVWKKPLIFYNFACFSKWPILLLSWSSLIKEHDCEDLGQLGN